jgi:hypothetical protein
MIRLELAGPHTRLASTLCAACPQGRAGCCAAPPAVAWADVARIAHLGGIEWILDEIQVGRLRPIPRGLAILRVEPTLDEAGAWPARCVYLGAVGCTISYDRRSATCNYYLCDDAFEREGLGEGAHGGAREAQDALAGLYGRWDLELQARASERCPEGPPWDTSFLEWLGREYARLVRGSRRAIRRLAPAGIDSSALTARRRANMAR